MPSQLVTKFKYLPSDARGSRGGYAKYIATREGVEKIDDSHRYAPATKKQQALAENLLKDFPDAAQLPEYETYRIDSTRENFSEFLDRVMEDHAEEVLSLRSYASYIALRPGAERTGRHGLFTNDGEEVVLDQVSKELNEHPGNVWTGVISLRREDAERLGFDSGERWRTLLRSHVNELAEDLKIELSHLRWYAAFHNEGHHPHVHLIAWSEDPREGYLSRQGVMQFRSAIARDVFAHDLLEVYQQETMLRDELRVEGRRQVRRLREQLSKDGYEDPVASQLMLTLARRLRNTKGKKVYGYLRHDLREMVNALVARLEEDRRIRELYDLWYLQKEKTIRIYRDETPKRIPLYENGEFKTIRNAVIQEAVRLGELIPDPPPTTDEAFAQALEKNASHGGGGSSESGELVAKVVLNLFLLCAKTMEVKIGQDPIGKPPHVDRKLWEEIIEKKMDLGMRM